MSAQDIATRQQEEQSAFEFTSFMTERDAAERERLRNDGRCERCYADGRPWDVCTACVRANEDRKFLCVPHNPDQFGGGIYQRCFAVPDDLPANAAAIPLPEGGVYLTHGDVAVWPEEFDWYATNTHEQLDVAREYHYQADSRPSSEASAHSSAPNAAG